MRIEVHTARRTETVGYVLLIPANVPTSKAAQAIFVTVDIVTVRCTLDDYEPAVHAVHFALT